MNDREKIGAGENEAAINETTADVSNGTSRELPRPPTDEEVARIARKLGAPFILGGSDQDRQDA